MSLLGDALNAIRSIILIEERVKSQGAKLEKLVELFTAMDRRLVRVETILDLATRGSPGAATPLAIADNRDP